MPVDVKQIKPQIEKMGRETASRQSQLSERRERAVSILSDYNNKVNDLNNLLIDVKSNTRSLRCAIPFIEDLCSQHPVPGAFEDFDNIVFAADGSQVNPDRHSPVEFGIINVGVFQIEPGSKQVPYEYIRSKLLYHDDLYTPSGPIGEEIVALRRDLMERMFLAELVKSEGQDHVIALTDGPLELYREPSDRQTYQAYLDDYIFQLRELSHLNAIVAGYVDRPRSDLVVRMLELTTLKKEEFQKAGKNRPLFGVFDYDLFIDVLMPGTRSAIFGIESSSASKFEDNLALHFFYLNVGSKEVPYIARVEIPQWVASDQKMIDILHLGLLQQCSLLGERPYPYALHRAHEIALVTNTEKLQLQELLIREVLKESGILGSVSNKQYAKEISGNRMRY